MTKRKMLEDSLLALIIIILFGFIFSFTHAFQKEQQYTDIQTYEHIVETEKQIFANFDTLHITPEVTNNATSTDEVKEESLEKPETDTEKELPESEKEEKPVVSTDRVITQKEEPLKKIAPAEEPLVVQEVTKNDLSQEGGLASTISTLIHEQTNTLRKSKGLESLSFSTKLQGIAQSHSVSMLEDNYFSHTDENGCDLVCRFETSGYTTLSYGENLAQMKFSDTPTAKEVVSDFMRGWKKSSGHLENLLSSDFTKEGIGVAVSNNRIYVTVDFSK